MKGKIGGAGRVVFFYLLFGGAWILLSDWGTSVFFSPETVSLIQTYKGLLYVLLTSVLIYWLVSRFTKKLIRSEARYRDLFESSPDALFVLDGEGRFLDINRIALERYGYTKAEMREMRAFDLVPENLRTVALSRLQECLSSPHQFDWKHLRKDGTEIPVAINTRPLLLEGTPCILCCARDITETFEAQEALRQSEDRYHSLYRSMNEGVCLHELIYNGEKPSDYRIVDINPAFEEITGLCRENVVGRLASEVYGVAPAPFLDRYSLVAETGMPTQFEVFWEPMQKHFRIGVFSPARRRFATVFGDITEARLAEEALRKSEEQYRILAENTVDCVWMMNLDMVFTYINPAVEAMLGYSQEEFIRTRLSDHCSPEELQRMTGFMNEELAKGPEGTGTTFETKIQDREGRSVDVEIRGRVAYSKTGQAIALHGMIRDITERRLMEEQLRQAQKMEAVGQLAGGVAHDFNNLLQAIIGYSSILSEGLADHPDLIEDLSEIQGAAERAASLTRQLLAFGRRQILKPQNLDLNQVFSDLLKMLGRVLPENIRLDFLSGHDLGTVKADRTQVEQVLMNLCVNARDAMPKGGSLVIETENVLMNSEYCRTHRWAKPGRYVLISVTDDGEGMDAETLSHIYEPFFTTKGVGKGTGLGLAVVYGIVKQHGGFIHAYSERGKGTTMKVYLPITSRQAESVGTKLNGPVVGGTETILVAEDDSAIRKLMRKSLEEAGYTVLLAENGSEALRFIQDFASRIDLLILDVVMPDLGGREVYERTRGISPAIPAIFSSGYSENAVHTGFVLDEGLVLLPKPHSREELLRVVRTVLDTQTTR